MKAISLWQPWATPYAKGIKRFETRSWPFPASLEGQWIAIHASKRWTRDEKEVARTLRNDGGIDLGFDGIPPLGCIVGVARLLKAYRTEDLLSYDGRTHLAVSLGFSSTEYNLGDYGPNRWAWHAAGAIALPEPLPYKGSQGFFTVDTQTVAAMREQLPNWRVA